MAAAGAHRGRPLPGRVAAADDRHRRTRARRALPSARRACWRTWPRPPTAGPGSACCRSWRWPTSRRSPGPPGHRVHPGGDPAGTPDRAGAGAARVLPDRHRRDGDPARAAPVHPAHRDLAGPLPPRARGHPADPGGRDPPRAGGLGLRGGHAGVRAGRRRGGRDRADRARPGQRPAAGARAAVDRDPEPVPGAGRRALPESRLPDPHPRMATRTLLLHDAQGALA